MSTITRPPFRPTIVYPDDDGQPMAENTLQFKWIVVVKEGLEAVFRRDPDVFVAGDHLWYAVEGEPTIRTAPDVMVVFGRPKGYRGSYKQWVEEGIAPQVVFKILSPGNRFGKMLEKFQFYDRYGVEEYYIYDPEDGSLEGWRRGADCLEKIAEMAGFVSPRLGIRFEPAEGPDNLEIIGPDGERFRTYVEVIEQLEAAHQRAEEQSHLAQAERERAEAQSQLAQAERERAEAQSHLAQAERERADCLAARLRELGGNPD
jgi:Uma2 family endonuclease